MLVKQYLNDLIKRAKSIEPITKTITLILFACILLFEVCVIAAAGLSNGVEAQLALEQKEDQALIYALGWNYDIEKNLDEFFTIEDRQKVFELEHVEDVSLVAYNRYLFSHYEEDRPTDTVFGQQSYFRAPVYTLFVEPSYFRIMEMYAVNGSLPGELDYNWAVMGAGAAATHQWSLNSGMKNIYDTAGTFQTSGIPSDNLNFKPNFTISLETMFPQGIIATLDWNGSEAKPSDQDKYVFLDYAGDHEFKQRFSMKLHYPLLRKKVTHEELKAVLYEARETGFYVEGTDYEVIAKTFFNPEPSNYLLVKIDSKDNITSTLGQITDTLDNKFNGKIYSIPVNLTPPLKVGMENEELKPLITLFLKMVGISMLLVTSLLMLHLHQERNTIAILRSIGASTDQIEKQYAKKYLKLSLLAALLSIPSLWLVLNICYYLLGIRFVFQISHYLPFLFISTGFAPLSSILCSYFVLGQNPIDALQGKSKFQWRNIDFRRELSVVTFFLLIIVIQQSTWVAISEITKLETKLKSSEFDLIQIKSIHKVNEAHLPAEMLKELIAEGVEAESLGWQGVQTNSQFMHKGMRYSAPLVVTSGNYASSQGLLISEGYWPQNYNEVAIGKELAKVLFGSEKEALGQTIPLENAIETKVIVGIISLGEYMERPELEYPLHSLYILNNSNDNSWRNMLFPLIIIRNSDYERVKEIYIQLKDKYSLVSDIRVVEASYDLQRTLDMQHSVMQTSWFLIGMLILQTCFGLFAFTIVKTREISKYTGIQRTLGAASSQVLYSIMDRTGFPFVLAGLLATITSLATQIYFYGFILSSFKFLVLFFGPLTLCIGCALIASWLPANTFSKKEPAALL